LNSGGSIEFTLDKAEYKLVSSVLDESSYSEATNLKDNYNETELWFKLTVSRPDGGTEGIQTTVQSISQVNIVKMNVLAMTASYSSLKKDFEDKVYNSETGLLEEKKDELKDLFTKNPGSLSGDTDYMVDAFVDEVQQELADYVKASIEGGYDSSSKTTKTTKILASKEINEFSAPIIASVYVNRTDDFCQPYGLFVDKGEWKKMDTLSKSSDRLSFEFIKAGKYFIGVSGTFGNSVPKEHPAYQNIVEFNNLYNIADVFSASGDFDPDTPMTVKESILILDKVFSKNSVNGEALQKKVARLGLGKYFTSVSPVKDLSREQAATLYTAAYCLKNGTDISTIKSAGVAVFNDSGNISTLHFSNVEYAVGQGYMDSDSNGMFNPSGYVTRANFIVSLQKVLQ
jgi:S-layer homology domain.